MKRTTLALSALFSFGAGFTNGQWPILRAQIRPKITVLYEKSSFEPKHFDLLASGSGFQIEAKPVEDGFDMSHFAASKFDLILTSRPLRLIRGAQAEKFVMIPEPLRSRVHPDFNFPEIQSHCILPLMWRVQDSNHAPAHLIVQFGLVSREASTKALEFLKYLSGDGIAKLIAVSPYAAAAPIVSGSLPVTRQPAGLRELEISKLVRNFERMQL